MTEIVNAELNIELENKYEELFEKYYNLKQKYNLLKQKQFNSNVEIQILKNENMKLKNKQKEKKNKIEEMQNEINLLKENQKYLEEQNVKFELEKEKIDSEKCLIYMIKTHGIPVISHSIDYTNQHYLELFKDHIIPYIHTNKINIESLHKFCNKKYRWDCHNKDTLINTSCYDIGYIVRHFVFYLKNNNIIQDQLDHLMDKIIIITNNYTTNMHLNTKEFINSLK